MAEEKTYRTAGAEELAALQGATLDPRGIRCRDCGCADFRVRETERKRDGTIARRRECRRCGRRITTREELVR